MLPGVGPLPVSAGAFFEAPLQLTGRPLDPTPSRGGMGQVPATSSLHVRPGFWVPYVVAHAPQQTLADRVNGSTLNYGELEQMICLVNLHKW